MVTTKMGNGTKFKLSNVLPNVFSKIKGIGPRKNNSRQKALGSSSSSPALNECVISEHTDQSDFSALSKHSHGERSPSPVRKFPQNRDGEMVRYSSSPILGHKTYDIRFPAESPVRSRGSKSRPHSPPPQVCLQSSAHSDPGCCSFESPMALVPQIDGRVRRAIPQALARCSILSKCNSFNGSTHSDSDLSETDTSRVHGRMHSRAMSVQLDGNPWTDGYGVLMTAAEIASHGSDTASARQRSTVDLRKRREQSMKVAEHSHQLYGGSSPVRGPYDSISPAAKYCRGIRDSRECQGSGCPNSSREETDLDHDQTSGGRLGRLSRKLSFSTDESGRPFDDTSLSSDEEFYKIRRPRESNAMGQYRMRSTRTSNKKPQLHKYGPSDVDADPGYTSSTSEVVFTEDERSHAASLPREAVLAKTVLNASDGWARVQLSRFSHDEKPTKRRVSSEEYDVKRDSRAVCKREASLSRPKDWARERAFAKANELDRETLGRLRACPMDHFLVNREEEADEMVDYRFDLPPMSREVFSRRSSRNPSPIGEVEKHTEGRIDYKSSESPGTNRAMKPKESGSTFAYEEFATMADCKSNLYKSDRIEMSEKEFGTPWDTEFPSFRSDSMLVGGGRMGSCRIIPEERAAFTDFSESKVSTPRTPRYVERQRQQNKLRLEQLQDFKSERSFRRSPSSREDVISDGSKNVKLSNQSPSPRRSQELRTRSKMLSSPSPMSSIQEISNGKKLSSRSPSPIKEISGRKLSSRSASPVYDFQTPVADFQQVKKSVRTASPVRDQSPTAGFRKLNAKAEAGMQRLDSVAVVKASYNPYHDFRESMVEMILENDIRTTKDLEDLLQCYLSLNSSDYHKIIVQVFTDIWGDIFEQ